MKTIMNLKQSLIAFGCPKFFIDESLVYSSIYNGNIEEFITYVEKELENQYLCHSIESLEAEDEIDMQMDEMAFNEDFLPRYT